MTYIVVETMFRHLEIAFAPNCKQPYIHTEETDDCAGFLNRILTFINRSSAPRKNISQIIIKIWSPIMLISSRQHKNHKQKPATYFLATTMERKRLKQTMKKNIFISGKNILILLRNALRVCRMI